MCIRDRLFGLVGLWFVDSRNYTPLNPSGESLPHVAHVTVILTMWALCGLCLLYTSRCV